MTLKGPIADRFLTSFGHFNEPPLRAELYGSDQMEQHGKKLASKHELRKKPIKGNLLQRLTENDRVLNAVRKLLVEAIKSKHVITPAGEWIVDNFYVLEEQIRIAKKHLPPRYYEALPQLVNQEAGLIRIYDLAVQVVSHTDGQIDLDHLNTLVGAYQSISLLKLGELWAIPTMLRLALIENIRRIAITVGLNRVDKNLADYWAGQMLHIFEHDPKSLVLATGDMARSNPRLSSAFVSEMHRQLLGKGSALTLSLSWIEQKLDEEGKTSNELIAAEIQTQAINQVTISNCIASLRLLSSIDWRVFVETHSAVEHILRQDHEKVYSQMDFPTRDSYRHLVEHLAKKAKIPEPEVAKKAIDLAHEAVRKNAHGDRKAHVGYYLIGKGSVEFKKSLGVSPPLLDFMRKGGLFSRLLFYFGFIGLLTIAIASCFLLKTTQEGLNPFLFGFVAVLVVLAASQCAISIVNFFSTLIIKPHALPRMDFSKKIPDDCRTLIVIPTMLSSSHAIKKLVCALEVRFLANRHKNLYFALLTDFVDAEQKTLPEDQSLLTLMQQGIQKLKEKYETQERSIFYLFHREREWNVYEKTWMGYERKRGKLNALNDLLLSQSKNDFSSIIGDISLLKGIKYVITLDSDTQLPYGAAWKMIATMAHPLNRAIYNRKKKRVTEGYGILQPRVLASLPESKTSLYSKISANETGIDPYTRASSDVYQDLFKEGSFIGKGIYDLAIFEKTLHGRFPDNRILSHDLLEGSYVRAGLLSDVELYEEYPETYYLDMKRRSRWIRGDWQILPWFLPIVPNEDGHPEKNPLSFLSRWKIFDNIRRSLVPISLTLLIIMGWLLFQDTLFWTLAVSILIVFPTFTTVVWDASHKPNDLFLSHHTHIVCYTTAKIIAQTLFSLLCIPFEAFVSVVAISRTIWRTVRHTRLLEWECSSQVVNRSSFISSYSYMWIVPFLGITIIGALVAYIPNRLVIAGPILVLWVATPYLTWWISKRPIKPKAALNDSQTVFLEKIARKTWSFFERFVGVSDNWLPPDNFQHHPNPVIAHHTSPTNIGLSLLANLSAYDFAYISGKQFLERTSRTIDTLHKMEKFKGHLYNWYHTQTLQPLFPKYISTVDSGNLAAHLLTLRQGIIEMRYQKIAKPKVFYGLLYTALVLRDLLDQKERRPLNEFIGLLEGINSMNVHTLISIYENLIRVQTAYKSVTQNMEKVDGTIAWWRDTLTEQLNAAVVYLQLLAPWTCLADVPPEFAAFIRIEDGINLDQLYKKIQVLLPWLRAIKRENYTEQELVWIDAFEEMLLKSDQEATEQLSLIKQLNLACIDLSDLEWDFLYDKSKDLLSIGYRVEHQACDPAFYDLLASEARLATFLAIAEGKLPEESWFALGRLLTNIQGDLTLLSWSGSMFEYLMPLLVMPTYENTLLDQTYKTSVKRQIDYGKQLGVPWGVSESGYNMVDAHSNYQYQAFGVPGLGLKRSLEADLVIAPYATMLSLMVAPAEACKNLELLQHDGIEGEYGFYEAIDYTKSRLARKQNKVVIQSYMAHHQGMSLLSLGYLLHGQPMQRRFRAEPQFQATLLLLQEHIPKTSAFYAHTTPIADYTHPIVNTEVRIIQTPHTPLPEVQLLSNGQYHVMVTASGGGYSRWKDIAVTRWREDMTCDNWGTFCYVRDVDSDYYWSSAYHPVRKNGDHYEVVFSQGRADFHHLDQEIDVHTEIVVSPEDDLEVRRIHVINKSSVRRTIELTSYAEVVLASQASDIAQPAFSNLFVQTEILPAEHAIICTRRPSASHQRLPWLFHSVVPHGLKEIELSYETDRMEFIGYGNTPARPRAMAYAGPLSGKQGSVLDPIVSIRCKIVLEANEDRMIDFITGVGDTREACEKLIKKQRGKHHKNRVFELAWTHSQAVLRQINASNADEQLFGCLASSVLFNNPVLRADAAIIAKNTKKQSDLWGYVVSGDLPIVLVQIANKSNIELVVHLIQAHNYWRLKGLVSDLVIWNESEEGYRQELQNQILSLIPHELLDHRGGIFIRAGSHIPEADRVLFQAVARVIISDAKGTLVDHLNLKPSNKFSIPYIPLSTFSPDNSVSVELPADLVFYNGLGGFSSHEKEYVMMTSLQKRTPLPWGNVIANPHFGAIVTESGLSYSWIENAREMRLTPWNNDIVSNSTGEVFYLRDEQEGYFWSPTPLPKEGQSAYITRHGQGYTTFEHIEDGIATEMRVYVDTVHPVKFIVLNVRNASGRDRSLSVTGYLEWVLGDMRSKTSMHIQTSFDAELGALFATNPYQAEFGTRVAFFNTDEKVKTVTGDRTEFIGRNGALDHPDAMYRSRLSGKVGVGLDPCAAMSIPFELGAGQEREIIFRLGAGNDMAEVLGILDQVKGADAAHKAFDRVKNHWKHVVSALQIETPDEAINMLINGWLTYQTLACRLWARSGYYQSGGAFGFRDQLQDVMALLHTKPDLARKQILLCASRQFGQGDVQHWWHPPSGRGVRTRISDDFLWLPYVTHRYIIYTGDFKVLSEKTHFLKGRPLEAKEESYYELPGQSTRTATLYEHCVRAIKNALEFGKHGLPLIGTGDWNDGMDRVGHDGQGESVWLGFFLYDILTKFITIATSYGDEDFAAECKKQADLLAVNLEKNAWDGQWYRRAYFDDGTPIGSASSIDCQIDSISQSWAVLSEATSAKRALTALNSAQERLVKRDAGIIQLLDPPFDKANIDPGYIRGYVPGVRENGGQYTHAAIWMIMAFAKLGDKQRTWELLQLVNPINHGRTPEEVAMYKVEPYVAAADVYARPPHTGRGGWTWYTGSAGWMYQLIVECFLGFRVEGDKLKVVPCIPEMWESFKVHYRYHHTTYHITVRQYAGSGKMTITVDGELKRDKWIVLVDDRQEHDVVVVIFSGAS